MEAPALGLAAICCVASSLPSLVSRGASVLPKWGKESIFKLVFNNNPHRQVELWYKIKFFIVRMQIYL